MTRNTGNVIPEELDATEAPTVKLRTRKRPAPHQSPFAVVSGARNVSRVRARTSAEKRSRQGTCDACGAGTLGGVCGGGCG